jgi:hypothetical protein
VHIAYAIAAIVAALLTLGAPVVLARIISRAFQTGQIRVPGNRFVTVARSVSRFDFYTAVTGWLARGIVLELVLAAAAYAAFLSAGWIRR